MQAEACFSGAQCFDFAEVLREMQPEDVLQHIRHWAQEGMTSLAVVTPKKEAEV